MTVEDKARVIHAGGFNGVRLFQALLLGFMIQFIMCIFGYYVGGRFLAWSQGPTCWFFALNAAYMTLGFTGSLLFVRWHRFAVRLFWALAAPLLLDLWYVVVYK